MVEATKSCAWIFIWASWIILQGHALRCIYYWGCFSKTEINIKKQFLKFTTDFLLNYLSKYLFS